MVGLTIPIQDKESLLKPEALEPGPKCLSHINRVNFVRIRPFGFVRKRLAILIREKSSLQTYQWIHLIIG